MSVTRGQCAGAGSIVIDGPVRLTGRWCIAALGGAFGADCVDADAAPSPAVARHMLVGRGVLEYNGDVLAEASEASERGPCVIAAFFELVDATDQNSRKAAELAAAAKSSAQQAPERLKMLQKNEGSECWVCDAPLTAAKRGSIEARSTASLRPVATSR